MYTNIASQPRRGLGRLFAKKVIRRNPKCVRVGPVPVNPRHSIDQLEGGGASSQRSFEVGDVLATLLDLALRIIVCCLRMPVSAMILSAPSCATTSSARFQLALDSSVD